MMAVQHVMDMWERNVNYLPEGWYWEVLGAEERRVDPILIVSRRHDSRASEPVVLQERDGGPCVSGPELGEHLSGYLLLQVGPSD